MFPARHAQAAAPLAPSPPAVRPEERSVHELLFGDGPEDAFFNRLDETDFSSLAAISPTKTPRHSNAAPWSSSGGPPCEAATTPLPLLSTDSIARSPFGSGGPSEPLSPLGAFIFPSRQSTSPQGPPVGFLPEGKGTAPTASPRPPPPALTNQGPFMGPVSGSGGRGAPGVPVFSDDHHARETPQTKVCLLVVGTGRAVASSAGSVSNAGMYGARGVGLADVVAMLAKELDRHGLTPEIDHLVSGDRAVERVRALANHRMWYRMVVLEVEGSLVEAAETARELRAANASAPIVAVAPHQVLLSRAASLVSPRGAQLQSEALRHFNDFLSMPVASATVRGLTQRWLIDSPEHAAAEAPFGGAAGGRAGVAAAIGPVTTANMGRAQDTESAQSSLQSTMGSPRAPPQHAEPLLPSGGGVSAACPSPASSYGATWNSANPGTTSKHDRLFQDSAIRPDRSLQPPALASPRYHEPLASQKGRVFGGGAEDRASPCRLFNRDFAVENAEAQEREYDFVFRHGTVVLKVEENDHGMITPVVFSACEYATTHFGKLIGKPLQAMFDGAATNKKTAANILQHIEEGDTDSICSYINLKSDGDHDMASFVSLRPLSRRPKRRGRERLPAWYALLKVCLPSTIGLIKEPQLLDEMYSRKAMGPAPAGGKRGRTGGGKATARGKTKPAAPKRGPKKPKTLPVEQ